MKIIKPWKTLFLIFYLFTINIQPLVLAQQESKPCTDKALNLLKQKDKIGYDIVTKVNDLDFFSVWLFCENPPIYNLPTAVHETNHKLSTILTDYENQLYGYYLGNENTIKVKMKNLFYRSEIGEYLDDFDKQQSYYELYLTGDSGNQDLLILLDEVNAYIHSLNSTICFIDLISKNIIQSDRDGLATFMYYLELYLKKARSSHAEQWEQIYNDSEYLTLIDSLWKRAESVFKNALKYPRLGMQDKFIIKKVYDKKNINELTETFSKGGSNFTYDANILKTVNNLKQTIIPAGNKTIKKPQKIISPQPQNQKQITTTNTITIDGKTMTLEEFKEYLKEHPELEALPQIQELLNKH